MAAQTIRWAGMRLTVEGAAEFQQKLRDVNNQLKISQGELNKVTNAFDRNEQNAETLAARHEHLTESLRLNAERQQALNMVMDDAINRYGENSSEVLGLRAALTEAQAEQVRLERALKDTEKAIRGQSWKELGERMEAAGEKMQKFGDGMQKVGKGLSVAVTAPILAIGAAAVAIGTDFENSMGNIQARTGMAADEVDGLGKSFREMALSGEYGTFTAREIAAAYGSVAVAGDDAAYATELMRMAMVMATANGVDLGSTAYFLGEYLRKVGKDASYAEKYTNLFTQGVANTGIGLSDMQNYMFRMTPAFQQFGASSETNVGIMTRLYQAGIRGANLYSGMGTIMMDLATRGDATNAMLERFGVSILDANGYARENKDIMFELAATMANYEDQTAVAREVTDNFNQTQQAAWFEFMNLSDTIKNEVIPSFYEATDAIEGTGIAFEMAAIQQDGLAGSAAQVRATLEEIKLQIAEHLMPHVQRFVDMVGGWVQRFAELDEGQQRTVIRLAGIAAAIGPILVIGGKLTSTVGKITSTFGKMSKAVGAAGGAKAYLAAKFPALTAGMAAASKATVANTTATAANTKAQAAFAKSKLSNIKLLATYTKATTAASVKMTAFATGMKAKAAGMGIVKIALAGVSAGFIKLTAAMLANPIGAIVAGVAALVAGITALVLWLGRAGEGYKELAEESEKWLERQREITEGAAAQAAAFEQNTRNMENNAEHFRNLADELEYLTSKQELSAGEMARLDSIINELNDGVDGLNLAFDEQTGALNMTAEAMEKYLAAAEAQTALTAQLEEQSRLQREAIDLAGELGEAERRLLELQEKQEDGSRRNRRERNLLQEAIDNEKEALELLVETMAANEEMQDALTYSIEIHAQALEDIRAAQEDAAAAIDETTGAIGDQIFSLEDWERAQSDAIEKINRSFEGYKRIASNAFNTVSENAAISVADLTRNLQENARAVEEWSTNLAILAERGVDEGLLEQLRQAGPEAAATVRELVEACDDELEELNDAFYNSTVVAVESMQRALDPTGVTQSAEELIDHVANAILSSTSMEDALVTQITAAFDGMDNAISGAGFSGLGENTIAGYLDGINNMMPDVDRAGADTADTYLSAITGGFEMRSPSRKMQRIGVNAGEGLIRGTRDIQPQVEDIARTLARAFVNNIATTIDNMPDIDNATRRQVDDIRRTADSAVAAMNFQSVGMEIANGVARGIDANGGLVSGAAQRMINNALNAMRAAAAISSPSRKTRTIGQQIIDGLTGGLASKMGELAAYCKYITDKVTDSLKIDTDDLIENSKDVLRSMQVALPALESNIRYITNPQATNPASTSSSPQTSSAPVHFHFGDVYVREDKDIERIVNMALRKLGKDVSQQVKIGGLIGI